MSAQPTPLSLAAENQRLATLLRESREHFLASFAGVSDADARVRPAENCWSVLDCVEHIAVAETGMLRLLQSPRRPRAAGAPNREQIFLEHMGSRSRKVESPERGRPTGRFPGLAAASKQFEVSREAAIRFAEQNTEDLRATEVTHPHPLVGDVSAFEMLIIMAKHSDRHALQIEDVKAALGLKGAGQST